jgi:hypothetical protein
MASSMNIYRWWGGVQRELYWDATAGSRRVPYVSVNYEDDPSHFTRVVIERDSVFNEPVTVAFEPSDQQRKRMVVSNKRFAFDVNAGSNVMVPTDNSNKLLRNSIFWCLGIESNNVTAIYEEIETGDDYAPSDLAEDSAIFDMTSLSSYPAAGNTKSLDETMSTLPDEVILSGDTVLTGLNVPVKIQNKMCRVYCREVPGNINLRVEFGEYFSNTYSTPGYSGNTEGIVPMSTSYTAARFWDDVWNNSIRTGVYLADMLDLRLDPAGSPVESDITMTVNAMRFIMAHLLSAGTTIIKVTLSTNPVYYGADTDTTIPVDSDILTASNQVGQTYSGFRFYITIPAGSSRVFFSHPVTMPEVKSVSYVELQDIIGTADVLDDFTVTTDRSLQHRVYTWASLIPVEDQMTYEVTL